MQDNQEQQLLRAFRALDQEEQQFILNVTLDRAAIAKPKAGLRLIVCGKFPANNTGLRSVAS